jgi:hypothetical protein
MKCPYCEKRIWFWQPVAYFKDLNMIESIAIQSFVHAVCVVEIFRRRMLDFEEKSE